MTQTKRAFCKELAGSADMLGEQYKDEEDFVRQATVYYNSRHRGIKDIIERVERKGSSGAIEVGWQIHLLVYLLIIYLIKLIIT